MLVDMTLSEFLKETSSSSPAPGGGSVCALAGALGAALSSMVGELTVGKAGDNEARIKGSIKICKELMMELSGAVDKDTEAFNGVMAAFKLPKSTDEEKTSRSAAIQEALKEAAELPYETALLCLDVMNVSLDMLKEGNKNAASDASVSGLLGYAALNGALYNVKINLASIKDKEYVEEMSAQVKGLINESEELLGRIKGLSAQIIG
jgi:formiminotetrahydrofolate cyclodeaminase